MPCPLHTKGLFPVCIFTPFDSHTVILVAWTLKGSAQGHPMAMIIKIQMVFEFNLIYFSNCLIGILNISEAIAKTCIACNVQIYIYLDQNH